MEVIVAFFPWNDVGRFFKNWGPLVISGLSILIAIISLIMSSKAQKLQNRINKMEIKLKENELEKVSKEKQLETRGLVEARVISLGKDNYRLKIWNSGGETAYNITAKFEGNLHIINLDEDKLPFEELETKKSFELKLLVYMDSASKAKVLTEWDDVDGIHQSKSQMVDF